MADLFNASIGISVSIDSADPLTCIGISVSIDSADPLTGVT